MEMLISYEAFAKAIEDLRRLWDFEKRTCQFLNGFDMEASVVWPTADQTVLDLLCEIFNDESDWIGYWIYELDFGRKYVAGCVVNQDTGQQVSLKTVSDLYDLLVENYVRNHVEVGKNKKTDPEEEFDWW